ncbi:MAG: glucokinase [Cyanobacteria bacterium P01_D01_bin.73]
MGTSTLLLAGDIGGTKTILRLVAMQDQPAAASSLETRYEKEYPSGDFPDLVPMVNQFFTEAIAAQSLEPMEKPARACFGIAGPVVENTSKLTNLGWTLTGDRLASALDIATVTLINDFVAVGYGVLGLEGNQLHVLQAGDRDPDAPIGVIGAGTGLGQGFVIKTGDRHRVFGCEGGHVDFAPRSELEWHLLEYLRDRFNISRVSVERVVSGQGIAAIYQFLRDREFAPESPEIGDAIRDWERSAGQQDRAIDPGALISQSAQKKSDVLCERSMELFISAYGAEAGNLALKLLPRGGLYIAGGIAAKNLSLMTAGPFMAALKDKGRVSGLLDQVPVAIVLEPKVGLLGASICAAQG